MMKGMNYLKYYVFALADGISAIPKIVAKIINTITLSAVLPDDLEKTHLD